MKKTVYIIGLSIILLSCYNKQKTYTKAPNDGVNTNLVLDNKSESAIEEKKYFSNIEEFKKFVFNKKWVDLGDECPCHNYSQSITIKDGYVHEYEIEPKEYKIDTIVQIDSKTLGLKIENDLNRDIVYKIEVLNFKEELVKWYLSYDISFEAKPYDVFCKDWGKETKKEIYYTSLYNINKAILTLNDQWRGLYYYKTNETDMGVEFILDTRSKINLSVNGDQYGYVDQLKAVQLGDTLGLFYHKNISGRNYNDTRSYDFLKFYKSSDGKFYFEGILPYFPEGAIEFKKVR